MATNPINDVLAANLAYFMSKKKLSQQALANKCKLGQTTISLYLNPGNRKLGATGKVPSAKLSEVEMLADALGVALWELLRAFSNEEREAYKQIENAFRLLSASIKKPNKPSEQTEKLAA